MRPDGGKLARLGLVALVSVGACAGSSGASLGGSDNGTGAGGGFGTGTGTAGGSGTNLPGVTGTGGGSADAGVVLPPEQELESSYQVPVATGRFVWVANPTSGRVAYIDASTLAVQTVEAGNAPTYLAAIPGGGDAVIVLNVLSQDATVLRAGGATLDSRTIPGIAPGSNAWAVSPDGRWAIAWTDVRRVARPQPSQGFQDATVVDLGATGSARTHTTLAVGFRPVSFSFAADSSRAFAVTEDGVSVIALGGAGGPVISSNVPLGDDANAAADTRDVSITADGRLAVVRREGSATVGIVDLASGLLTPLALSGPVTDVDVTADGARAVAVVRDTSEVAVIPLGATAPAATAVTHLTVTGETVGQVVLTGDGATAVLYSNALPSERITVVSLAGVPAWHVVRLHAPVLSVFPTPDGKEAVVLHPADAPAGDGGSGVAPSTVDGGATPPAGGGFSLVPLDGTHPARIQMADAPIQVVALSPASDRALITVRDDVQRIYGVYLGLFPTLEVRRTPLASPPIAAGVVAGAGRAYVAQQHPEGRITFIALDSGDARTLTGFELGARVVDWSRP